ncbi:MAG TPA: ChbG/HpnK family deacetylase [Phaeodactylibacter sp.]|nr:ChbG/HpnK family deacetylase [Phaeodactylibacter sp.]
MKKVIITADDYGVIPSIDKAIIEALQKKKINSVAAFSNYDGIAGKFNSSMENARILLEKTNGKVDLGCHLTITSGKPVTGDKANSLVNEEGDFRDITEFKRDVDRMQLRNELNEQIMRFKDAGFPISHLSCHHNVLTLFPEIYGEYLKVCRNHQLAIRSHISKPSKRYNLYLKILSLQLSDGDLDRHDRKSMRHFCKEIGTFFKNVTHGKIATTDYFESRHYGPLPMRTIRPKNISNIITKKHKVLRRVFSDFRKGNADSMEIVCHIAKDNLSKMKSYKEVEKTGYSGVEPKYFDSRVAEFFSIMNFDSNQYDDVSMGKWSEV